MSENQNSGSQWQIMLPNGRIIGPFTTAAILKMLSDNSLSGQEKIRKIGTSEIWTPFSKSIEFYEKLMELALSDAGKLAVASPIIDVMAQETIIRRPQGANSASNKGSSEIDEQSIKKKELVIDKKHPQIEIGRSHNVLPPPGLIEAKENLNEVLDLNIVEESVTDTEKANKKKKIIGILALVTGMLLLYLVINEAEVNSTKLRLIKPNYGKGKPLEASLSEKLFQQGVFHFQKDAVQDYLESQTIFVKLLEASTKDTKSRAFLCLTQRELWPYVSQNSTDQEIFTSLVKSTRAIDPAGESGAICEISRLLAMGKINEARGAVDYYLAQTANSNNPIFIAFKAEVLGRSFEYSNAILFLETAQKIWPNWAKLHSLKGQYELLDGQIDASLKSFQEAIKINPKHKVSHLNSGIIQYRFKKNLEAAVEALKKGFQISSKAPRLLEVKGYKTLAQIYKESRDLDKAKKYIELAYALQPGDQEIKNLYLELGGSAGAAALATFKQGELVYLGDQYVNLGDCLAAQAEYKAAFEIDPKNAIAAKKAGKCLWELAQPNEAVEWIKKAIKSDPQLLEASVLLADIYSQRYDFAMAGEVLSSAAKRNPNNAEILKGYGLIEYRRNNLKAAIGYLNRSLKIYDNDEGVLILLAKSSAGLGNFDEAQNFAIRALEIDPTNPEAMVIYGKNLAQHKGISAGINYLNEQIEKFSYTIELRIALAEVYLELERFSEAERIYSQIVEYNPKSKKAWIGLGKSYQAQLKYLESIKAFIEAGILDVSDAEPLYLLGRVYLELNQVDKAITHFAKAIKINPNYPNLYYHSGRAALMKGDLKLALEYALKERQKNPNIVESYLLAAQIYDLNQEYQMCSSEYQRALKLRPQGAVIHVKMARCYRLAGATDVAESMLNIAASIESGLPEIYREQGAIFESKMDFRAAILAYEKYLMLSPNAKDKAQVEQKILQLQK